MINTENVAANKVSELSFRNSPGYQRLLYELVRDSDIIILDDRTVMHPGFEPMLSDWILLLKSQNKCFVLPEAALKELHRLSGDKDRIVRANAICALDTLRILRKNDVVRINSTDLPANCVGSEDEIIAMLRACRAKGRTALVLTQSEKLAMECLQLSNTQVGRVPWPVKCKCIANEEGQIKNVLGKNAF